MKVADYPTTERPGDRFVANVSELARFMEERHRIYLRRSSGQPGPWTQDPILRDNRFCNIFRELDRVTIWVRENIREPFASHDHLWFMLAIARYINWPPTLKALMERRGCWPSDHSFAPGQMTSVLEDLAANSDKVYTGAYMIRAESDPRTPWYTWSKHKYIAEVVLGKLWRDRDALAFSLASVPTLQASWALLAESREYTGWGPFMSYEWVTDLRHTRYLRDAQDIYTWANAGPGAVRGLNRLHGRFVGVHIRPSQTCKEMTELLYCLNHIDDRSFCAVFGGIGLRFEMRDVEHALCEFDKYQRIKLGQGRMRAKYNWRKAEPL